MSRTFSIRCPRCGFRLIVPEGRAKRKEVQGTGYRRAYEPWTVEEDLKLVDYAAAGHTIGEIARMLGRTPGAVRRRLEVIGQRETANGPTA